MKWRGGRASQRTVRAATCVRLFIFHRTWREAGGEGRESHCVEKRRIEKKAHITVGLNDSAHRAQIISLHTETCHD